MPATTDKQTEFTKGPWGITDDNDVADENGSVVAVIPDWDPSTCPAGDARLIAAAPDLFAALEKAAAKFREYERSHQAKADSRMIDAQWARGPAEAKDYEAEAVERGEKAERNREMAEICEAALAKARGEAA